MASLFLLFWLRAPYANSLVHKGVNVHIKNYQVSKKRNKMPFVLGVYAQLSCIVCKFLEILTVTSSIERFSWQYREAHVNRVYLIGAALLLVSIVATSMWAHQLSVVVSSAVAAIRLCTGFFLYCLELNLKHPMCSQTYWCT